MGFFDDMEKSLLQAIEIDKGNIPLEEKENMSAPTFVAVDREKPYSTERRREQKMCDRKEINYAVACINEFGRQKNLSTKESYLYLVNFKGIEFLKDFYDVEHLLSFEDVVEDLARICRNNGGAIL
ncbi:MAG: DUF3791 domain-containing protein [Clostridiales bacterium]|nr:DUF3791 domain-containing protein [Clostridiales bacterium]